MNYDIIRLLENIKNNSDCLINRSCGQPLLRTGEKLPDDLKLFYEKCGGVKFNNTRFQFEIVSPKEMVLANPIIVGELCEEDISSEWYIIGKDNENNYISIDLGEKRIGRCYDSFWDRHGVVGECSVIARSFTELLWNFIYTQGDDIPYWLEEDFNYIGDAYDDL